MAEPLEDLKAALLRDALFKGHPRKNFAKKTIADFNTSC